MDGRPHVEDIEILSTPEGNDTYVDGEVIRVALDFSQEVDVEDSPQVYLDMSRPEDEAAGAWASYESGTSTDRVVSACEVDSEDNDSNGIAIPENGRDDDLYFKGGTFRAKDAEVGFNPPFLGLKNAPKHKVDGAAVNASPSVVDFSITSDPGGDKTYVTGGEIRITVRFSGELTITTPSDSTEEGTTEEDSTEENADSSETASAVSPATLTVTMGEGEVPFSLQDSEGATIVFAHSVQLGDLAPGGLSMGEDNQDAGSLTIKDEEGKAADLSHDEVPSRDGHRVFGGLTVAENEPGGTSVGNPDALSCPYSIGGEDADLFTVDPDTGEVFTAQPPVFESEPVLHVEYTGNGITRDLLIGVIGVNEPGVGTLSASSHEEGGTLTARYNDPTARTNCSDNGRRPSILQAGWTFPSAGHSLSWWMAIPP